MAAAAHPPPVTPPPHTDAYMDMAARRGLFRGFGLGLGWILVSLLMTIAYLTFVLAAGANWLAALVIIAAAGWVAGALLRFGGAWTTFVVALVIGVVAIRVVVAMGTAITG